MTMMSVDESSDLMSKVASNIRHLTVHNCRGVVSSLLRTDLPFDQSARMIWTALADGKRLSTDVFDILMEVSGDHPVRQTVSGAYAADPISVACISALSAMMDTHNLETLCREEFGKLFSHLVVISAQFVNAKYERKKSDTGAAINISPFIVALEAFR